MVIFPLTKIYISSIFYFLLGPWNPNPLCLFHFLSFSQNLILKIKKNKNMRCMIMVVWSCLYDLVTFFSFSFKKERRKRKLMKGRTRGKFVVDGFIDARKWNIFTILHLFLNKNLCAINIWGVDQLEWKKSSLIFKWVYNNLTSRILII